MRRLMVLAALLVVGGFSAMGAVAAQPEKTERVNPVAPQMGDPVTYVRGGEAVATITVTGITHDWDEYGSSHKPRAGTEYLAFAVEVTGLTSDEVTIDSKDFDVQVDPGQLQDLAGVRSETAEPPMLRADLTVTDGDTVSFLLVYALADGAQASHLFWVPDGAFLTVAQIDE